MPVYLYIYFTLDPGPERIKHPFLYVSIKNLYVFSSHSITDCLRSLKGS